MVYGLQKVFVIEFFGDPNQKVWKLISHPQKK